MRNSLHILLQSLTTSIQHLTISLRSLHWHLR